MKVSQQVLEWQAEAVVKTQQENVSPHLCGSAPPASVVSAIQANTEPEAIMARCCRKDWIADFRAATTKTEENDPMALSSHTLNITRRHFFRECGVGVGKIALASLLTGALRPAPTTAPGDEPAGTEASRTSPRGRSASSTCSWPGAPSQLDLFDPKPTLAKLEGKPLPPSVIGGQRYAFIRSDANVMGPALQVQEGTASAAPSCRRCCPTWPRWWTMSASFKSMHTDQFNHAPAQIFLNTGFAQPGRPSIGSWVAYGLGSEIEDLPGVRRHVHRQRHQRRLGQLVERLPAHGLHRRSLRTAASRS